MLFNHRLSANCFIIINRAGLRSRASMLVYMCEEHRVPVRLQVSCGAPPWTHHPGSTPAAVCSSPQSQQSLVDSPQCSIFAPNLPTPVGSLFSRVQTRRDRPTPCPLFDGVGMNVCSLVVVYAHDSAHLAGLQCFTVSCGGTYDTSCWASLFGLMFWERVGDRDNFIEINRNMICYGLIQWDMCEDLVDR